MKTTVATPRQRRSRLLALAAVCVLATGLLQAQSPAVRIQAEVNSSIQSKIPGSQHPLAQARFDVGRMPAATKLMGMTISFNLTAQQQANLQALLKAQQNPNSSEYHHWLTPEEYGARFGMSDADLEKVEQWLQSEGFTIDSVNNARNAIHFSGTVGQVEQAFGTEMHYYNVAGEKHFAPSTALSVPSAIASVVSGVQGVNDFRPKAMHIPSRRTQKPRAAYTFEGTNGTQYALFAPGDIRTAYDINPLLSAGNTGAGQTIAVMGQSAIQVSDIENFQAAAGLTKKDPVTTLVPNTGASTVYADGDEGESDLDIEWSGAIAPGATINFVYTGNGTTNNNGVFTAYQYAVDSKIGNIITISYGSCETALSSSDLSTFEQIGQEAASQGQTVIAASGDSGATACYGYEPNGLTTAQANALAVNYPASSAYVTGVGGTEITATNATPGSSNPYWQEVPSSSTTGIILNSANEYIPEIAWNDDALTAVSGCVNAAQNTYNCVSATGGGKSADIAQPTWQTTYFSTTAETNPDSSHRLVPDVALYASPNYPGYLYCTSDQSDWDTTNGQTGSCVSSQFYDANGIFTIAGGTSFAAPIFAGMMADLNQAKNYTSGQGLVNTELYSLAANSTTYGTAFHDVTSGNNECTQGSSFCPSSSGYSAGTGYDMVTGLGSVDLNNLATAWSQSTSTLVGTTTTITASNSSPTVNTSVNFTITVAAVSGTATPTGTVSILVDGGTAVSETLTSNGTYVYADTFTTAGSHTITANYTGDTTFASSTGTITVTVGSTSSGKGTFTMGFSPSTLTVSQGSSENETLTITPSGGYTGTVGLSYSTSNNNALANLCLFGSTGFNSDGTSITIPGTSAVSGTIQVDTNAADCGSTAAVAAMARRGFHVIPHAGNSLKTTASNKDRGALPGGLALAGLLLMGFLGRSSRKLSGLACILALAVIGLAMSACGGGNDIGGGTSDPSKGTYTITFTGTDSTTASITAQQSFTLTID